MNRPCSNLYKLMAGCTHLYPGDVERLADAWQTSAMTETFADYLANSGLSKCDTYELGLVGDDNRCIIKERELNLDYGLLDGTLNNIWFTNGQTAAPGILQVWDQSLPSVVFSQAIIRPGAVSSSSFGRNISRVPSNDTLSNVVNTTIRHAQAAFPRAGDTLGRCLLEKEVARGGASVVFLATHQKLNIKVAVKILMTDPDVPLNESLEAIRREARLLAQITHPNVIRVFDVEDEGQWPYLVMEYVEGSSLASLIQNAPLSVEEVIRIALRTAEGLEAAEKIGVLHRDIKPANIVLNGPGDVKVVDFGLGTTVHSIGPKESTQLAGTALYMSPEQARCESRIDFRTDIYSLGATIYHALIGTPPFNGKTLATVLMQHVSAAPPSARDRRADVPVELNALILRMLAKSPKDRFSSYQELIFELKQCELMLSSTPTVVEDTHVAPRKSSIVSWLRPGTTATKTKRRRVNGG